MNNVLYFSDSSIKILSENELAESIKDDEVTYILTKIKYSIFTWDFGKYKNKIAHSEKCLLELYIQANFSKFYGFFKIVGSISGDYTFKFSIDFICTREYLITVNTMKISTEVEYEVIRETVLHKLDIPLVNP